MTTDENRHWKGRRGAPAQTAKRDEFLRLLNQGLNNSEACRRVGVNRRTGTRWRYGRSVDRGDDHELYYAPVVVPVVVSERFLSESERLVIADGLRDGQSMRAIAEELGRSPSTISREVNRNRCPGSGQYRPYHAQHLSAARRGRPKQRLLQANLELRGVVQDGLGERWSPEQIANTLVEDYPDRDDMRITAETIYQEIYALDSVLRRDRPVLRTRRLHRRRRRGQRRERFVAPMVMICERPAEVDDRLVPGHWEGDLIVGAHNRSAIATLVERTSLFTMLIRLGRDRSSEHLRDAMVDVFAELPQKLRRTLTWDQGVEMARHHEFALASGVDVYFCEAGSPWQRPTNENTNGLLREYFPKGADLAVYSVEDVASAAAQLNDRPRKRLGWKSPSATVATLLQ